MWEMGRAGTVHPVLYSPDIRCGFEFKKYSGLVSSISNPYSIPGLYRMYIAGFSGWEYLDIRVSWSHTAHRLYHNDIFRIRLTATRAGRLSSGIVLRADSRGVQGTGRENLLFVEGVAAFRAGELFSAGWEMILHHSGGYRFLRNRLIISFKIERLSILVNRDVYGQRVSETAAGLELALSDRLSLLSGYRFRTGEISFGIFCWFSGSCFGISWSDHPVLGTTAGCGLGGFRTR
ncbi:MAG: hypothetical protein R6U43_00195 [Candidatus Krumholzibacteriales bacterium]